MKYSEKQNEAIHTIHGPVMVISCAGSGKTSVILERTKKMVSSGIPSENILVVTFSKAAALEMEERFSQQYQNTSVKFATIHSVCYSILARAYGLTPSAILKTSEKSAFFHEEYIRLKKAFGHGFSDRYKDISDFSREMELKISMYMSHSYKDSELNPDEEIADQYEKEIYFSYLKFKKICGKIDYDDIIIECHRYLKVRPDALRFWQNIFRYIMIDEYQDTTVLQAEIFFMLAHEDNIFVVGDDDQSIYSFRDADSGIFKIFLARYPEAKQIFLEVNYRSKPQIIYQASNLIQHNKNRFSKIFLPFREGIAKIETVPTTDHARQADEVIRRICEYRKQKIPLYNISVLYRTRSEISILCNRIMAEGVPFYTKEPPDDIHRSLVYQDIKAYYRLANGLAGRTDLRRIINRPKRYIKAETVVNCGLDKEVIVKRCTKDIYDEERKEQVVKAINKLFFDLNNLRGKSPTEFMQYLMNNMKYHESLTEYAKFLGLSATTFTSEFDELLFEAKKFGSMPEWDSYADEYRDTLIKFMDKNKQKGVYLSTFHSAKGLEWNHVIIISANEKITPLQRNGMIENPEEERRLFYVAVTRAKEELVILHLDSEKSMPPSRYISEMQKYG